MTSDKYINCTSIESHGWKPENLAFEAVKLGK